MIVNLITDQTGVSVVPSSEWTMELKGEKQESVTERSLWLGLETHVKLHLSLAVLSAAIDSHLNLFTKEKEISITQLSVFQSHGASNIHQITGAT